jgi:hypothetical protein
MTDQEKPRLDLRQARGMNLVTKKEQLHSHYDVYFEGSRVAIVGWSSDSTVIFVRQLGPLEKEEVVSFVSKKLSLTDARSVEPRFTDLSAELSDDDEDNYHEFN